MLLECGTFQELHDEFYEEDSLAVLFESVPLRWLSTKMLDSSTWYDDHTFMKFRLHTVNPRKPQNEFNYCITNMTNEFMRISEKTCRTADVSWRTCVIVKQTQFHSIPVISVMYMLEYYQNCVLSMNTNLSNGADNINSAGANETATAGKGFRKLSEPLIFTTYHAKHTITCTCTIIFFWSPFY